MEALYLSLSVVTAIKEISQGLSAKIHPCVVCSYDVDCQDIADLRSETTRQALHIEEADINCAWFAIAAVGGEPPSWAIARRLMADGFAGILAPSFAPGATSEDHNLILWKWGRSRPHRTKVFDPSGRLPKDQLSWK